LRQWLEPARLPQILDASTGDPMPLVTDHYRVRDAAALAAALAAQPDVSGNAQQSWHRETRGSDDELRRLVAVNPGREADRIEVFHRTQRPADAGRTWLEAPAGSAVQHLTREITDPASSVARAPEDGYAVTPAADSPAPSLPPEVMAQVFEQFIHRHCAPWWDETIPALRETRVSRWSSTWTSSAGP